MNLKEKIIYFLESNEESYKKVLTKLQDFEDVNGLDELINLILSMDNNDYFVEFYKSVEQIKSLDDFKYKKDYIYGSNNDFIKFATSQLYEPKFPLFQSSENLIMLSSLEAVLMLIVFNFYFFSKNNVKSILNIVKLVFDGNIICHFTFFVDEFKEGYCLPEYSEKFFDKLSIITFEDDRSKTVI